MTRTAIRAGHPLRWLACFLLLLQTTLPTAVLAEGLPGMTGPNVVAGQAAITTDGSTMNVNTVTDHTIINWQGFSIGAGETANFIQPSASSSVLNRVTALNNPSLINGALNSNGNVILVNPSGVFVSSTGVINTNGFTASVLDIPNNEFLQNSVLNFRGDSTASVINEGTIKTGSGGAALIGGDVVNTGVITSDGGSISLATGGSVTLADGSRFTHADLATIEAGLSPYAGVIQNSGTIRATGAIEAGGEVFLVNPGGRIMHDGTIAAHVGANGGSVNLAATAGGDVVVAGNIEADGIGTGNGGNVVVTANATEFTGSISARGGDDGGNGGQVEVSGRDLALGGTIDVAAPAGEAGTVTLDPAILNIDAAAATTIVSSLAGGGTVNVEADDEINVNAEIDSSAQANTATLNFRDEAPDDNVVITLNAGITLGAVQDLNFDGAVVLGTDTILVANDVTFNKTLDGTHNLTVNADGTTSFLGNIGFDGDRLGGLVTDAAGSTRFQFPSGIGQVAIQGTTFLGDDVNMSGVNQTWNLFGETTFDGAVNGAVDMIMNPRQDLIFNDTVSFKGLQVTNAGRTVINGGSLTTTSFGQVYGDVVLGADTALNAAGNIRFRETVSGNFALTLNANDTININNGASVSTNSLVFNADIVNLDANLTAPGGISGTASVVNVIGSTGGAELQDAVDVAQAGATVNVGDGSFAGGVVVDKALSLLGDGFSNTTTINVADSSVGLRINSSNVNVDGFLFTGDGTPDGATGVVVNGAGGALSGIIVGDGADPGVAGNRFDGLTTGLRVRDGGTGNSISVAIGIGNEFANSNRGMVLRGSGVNISGNTINNTAFSSISGNYIRLDDGASFNPGMPTVIDAKLATFDGSAGFEMTPDQLIATENKMVHFPDDNTLGLIDLATLFVVEGESIQTAVNDAGGLGGTQTVVVGEGTFGGSVEVWVDDLTLLGQGNTTIIDTDAVDPFANNGNAGNGFEVTNRSQSFFGSNTEGVTIDGFQFVGTGGTTGIVAGGPALIGSHNAEDLTILNSRFDGLVDGISARRISGATEISNVVMSNVGQGLHVQPTLILQSVTIEDSDLETTGDAVRFDGGLFASRVEMRNNSLNSATGDGVNFGGDISILSSVLIGGTDVTDANTIAAGDDGIEFEGEINGSSITIAGNNTITGVDEGVEFDDTITAATVRIVGNEAVGGRDNGIMFNGAIENLGLIQSGVTIAGNDLVAGVNDAIGFNGPIENSNVTIGPAVVLLDGGLESYSGNGRISGGEDGINVNAIIDSSFQVAENGSIRGATGSGIEFDGLITDGSDIDVTGNREIFGGDYGVEVDDAVVDSDVSIAGNRSITGENIAGVSFRSAIDASDVSIIENLETLGGDFGIEFDGTIDSSEVAISGNRTIIGEDRVGIMVDADLDQSEFTISGNGQIIGDNNGVRFDNPIDNSDVFVRGNGLIVGDQNSGVLFHRAINNDSDIRISGNREILGDQHGVEFRRSVNDSSVSILVNRDIRGVETSGISFQRDIDESTVLILGNRRIFGGDDGIEIEGINNGFVGIAGNETITGESVSGVGIYDDLFSPFLSIRDNGRVRGGQYGVLVDASVEGGRVVVIDNGRIVGRDDAGIAFLGELDPSIMSISRNDVRGGNDAIVFGGLVLGQVNVADNLLIGRDRDGVSFERGVEEFARVRLADNRILAGQNGIDVAAIRDFASVRLLDNNIRIIGDGSGIRLEEVDSRLPVLIAGGSTTGGAFGLSVLQNNEIPLDGHVIVSGLEVNDASDTGISFRTFLEDHQLEVTLLNQVTINGGAGLNSVGMVFDGPGMSLTGDTLGNTRFVGTPGNFIELRNGGLFEPGRPTLIDGTGVFWSGLDPGIPAQRQVIINRIVDFIDQPTLGLIFPGAGPPADQTYDRFTRYDDYFRTIGALMGPYSSGSINYRTPTVEVDEGLGEGD